MPGAAGRYAANTKTATQTAGLLANIVAAVKKPNFVLTALAVIGTYPFSLFIKEEALQAIKGSYTGAMIAGNFEQAQIANDERQQILDPGLWDKIIATVPFANSVNALVDLLHTARVSVAVDQAILDDELFQIEQEEAGRIESEDQKWARIKEEERAGNKAAIDYYNEQRKLMIQFEQEAAREKRIEDARFWAKEAAKQRELEADDRKAIADFWNAYRKTTQQIQNDNRPSNLNFGLL